MSEYFMQFVFACWACPVQQQSQERAIKIWHFFFFAPGSGRSRFTQSPTPHTDTHRTANHLLALMMC